jgi:PEP-CTERM motif
VQIEGSVLYGTGVINGDVVTDGIVAPGKTGPNSVGILTINGSYTQTGIYEAEMAGLMPGAQYDQLAVNGNVSLYGSLGLQVDFLHGFVVSLGDTFVLMTFNNLTGTFGTLDLPNLPSGEDWLLSYGGNDITLSVVPTSTPEPTTFLLLGSRLLGAVGLLRRRRSL